MTSLADERNERCIPEGRSLDQRRPSQRDRDRILYSTAFRRLAGVTQVVGVSEGHQFHNRLTHTIKVGQIARRIAEHLCDGPQNEVLAAEALLDPEVAEAAALAHDIGHPPFGHVAEHELCHLVDAILPADNQEGFEGNAQSFRIVTRLALRTTAYDGLNLTRATLRAILKYPWMRGASGGDDKRRKKYGAYASDAHQFRFAAGKVPDGQRSVEAEIMDWSDDIAYSVHDLEDFWKAGVIPLGRLVRDQAFLDDFLTETYRYWQHSLPASLSKTDAVSRMLTVAHGVLETMPPTLNEAYDGRTKQRADARQWTSSLVGRYIQDAIHLEKDPHGGVQLKIHDEPRLQVEFLKTLTRRFAVFNPTLGAQQSGYKRLIAELFESYLEIAMKERSGLPHRYADSLVAAEKEGQDAKTAAVRTVVDLISSLTEPEAIDLHRRVRGLDAGKVIDPIIR